MNDRRPPIRSRPAAALTLVEILVVIGVVVLLIGLLLPAVSARSQAATVRCQANMRSTGQSLAAYAAANRGWAFPVTREPFGVIGLGLNVPPHMRWPMQAMDVPGAPMPPAYDLAGYERGRAGDAQYDAAPYTPRSLKLTRDERPAMAHTYVLNNHLADEGIRVGHAVRGVSTSELIVAGEKRESAGDYYMECGDYERVVEPVRHGAAVLIPDIGATR